MIIHYFPLLSIILFPVIVVMHFFFRESSQIGNAQILEESLGERMKGWGGKEGKRAKLWEVRQNMAAAEQQNFYELLSWTSVIVRDWEDGKEHLLYQYCVCLILTTVASIPVATSSWSHLLLCSLWPAFLQDTTPWHIKVPGHAGPNPCILT